MNETQTEYCYECLHSRNKFTPHRKGYRVCAKCKVEKKYSEFVVRKNRNKHNITYSCKVCKNRESKKYYENNPLAKKEQDMKRTYGITLDDYDRMLKSQNNRCAICNGTETGRIASKYLAIDHCHTTGKVRGLLCFTCNTAIGHMKDDVELLEKAIAYLGEK